MNRTQRLFFQTARAALRRYRDDESGLMMVFGMFVLLCMMLVIGLSFDVIRYEVARTKLQNTLDRAVLAAADLDQSLDPEAVVEDYFARVNMDDFLGEVRVDEGLNFRTVSADARAVIPTQFMQMIGIKSLNVPTLGEANETITDVEISLVLDNSGSMGWENDYRLDLLKAAAKDFVDIVIPDAGEGDHKVSINIVPFAMQVSAGPDLLQYYNVSNEHGYSHCVDFDNSDFTTAAILTTQALQRTGHFDPWNYNMPPHNWDLVCPTDSNRHITVMGHDKQTLKDKIDDMWAGGNTSIDIGTKWGLALLDPSARPAVTGLVNGGKVSATFAGRPFDYTEEQVLKVLVVMSDGENTDQFMLDPNFRSGDSPFFVDRYDGGETWYHNRGGTSNDYYYDQGNTWRSSPWRNWDRAERYTWPEVWASRSIMHFGYYTFGEVYGHTSDYYRSYFTDHVSPYTKNNRTSDICAAARAKNITVYTIGMDTYGQGDATLSDCATSSAFFFDVDAVEIGQAFAAIARDINRLRLTQ